VVRAVLALSLVLTIGCAGAGDLNVSPLVDAGSGDVLPLNCDPPQFTYMNFGNAFLTEYCSSCHGFTQQDMRADPAAFIDVAVTSTYMPLSTTTPSQAERMEFGTWLSCGAP
jgi:hypothetical protein